jgi:anti-anti-sigma regulatory factor
MYSSGDKPYRYLKTIVREETVHVVLAENGGVERFADFMEDLADAERSGGTIIVDLQALGLIERRMLETLQRAARRVGMRGDRFMLVCADPKMRKLLELTGVLYGVLTFDSVTEAITHVRDTHES